MRSYLDWAYVLLRMVHYHIKYGNDYDNPSYDTVK